MARRKFSRGVKKFIRMEKARIRREVFDSAEKERRIKELVMQFQAMRAEK
ncbi:MAG: hypothetical protein AAB562_04345 [Patescibacteria group bacterium]